MADLRQLKERLEAAMKVTEVDLQRSVFKCVRSLHNQPFSRKIVLTCTSWQELRGLCGHLEGDLDARERDAGAQGRPGGVASRARVARRRLGS